jgi:hypothetical protein
MVITLAVADTSRQGVEDVSWLRITDRQARQSSTPRNAGLFDWLCDSTTSSTLRRYVRRRLFFGFLLLILLLATVVD